MKIFDRLLRLVVFDVDGVLLDLNAVLQQNFETAARYFGLPIDPIAPYLYAMATGMNRGKAGFSDSICAIWQLSQDDAKAYLKKFQEVEHANPIPAFPYTHEVLEWLEHHHIAMALCTNNSESTLWWKLNVANIPFDFFIAESTSSLGFLKPDPRMIKHILLKTRIPKENAIFIGDWYADIDAARAANIDFVATLSGGLLHEVFIKEGIAEDHIINSIADLSKLIVCASQ